MSKLSKGKGYDQKTMSVFSNFHQVIFDYCSVDNFWTTAAVAYLEFVTFKFSDCNSQPFTNCWTVVSLNILPCATCSCTNSEHHVEVLNSLFVFFRAIHNQKKVSNNCIILFLLTKVKNFFFHNIPYGNSFKCSNMFVSHFCHFGS